MRRTLHLILLPLVACVAWLQFNCSSEPAANTGVADTLAFLNHHDTVKYVGMETCRSCHGAIYNTFIRTGMGQSFDVASRQKSAADFAHNHTIYDKENDYYYTTFWQGDSLFMMEFRLSGRDTVHKRTEKVSYIIGPGQHTNSHIMEVNGYLYQMPMTWYAQQGKWDLPPGFENGRNSRFTRIIGEECMSCHNALPAVVKNSENRYTTIPRGIDCERCHGPGELHVKEKLAGVRVDTSGMHKDRTIVNPRKLSWERQIDLCQRCHLQGNSVLKPGKSYRDFRPGMKLSDYWDVFMPRYAGADDEFIMASHADRLQQSKCFVVANKGQEGASLRFTCITCHNPHVSVKVTGKEVFNTACVDCHDMKQLRSCSDPRAVKQIALSSDLKHPQKHADCVGCHMPRSGTVDIPHVTVHDHYIRRPLEAGKADAVKRYIGIACVNEKNPDVLTRAQGYINYYERFEGPLASLDTAQNLLGSASTYPDRWIHASYLRNDLNSVVQTAGYPGFRTDDPWTAYRIGQTYLNKGDYSKAITWLEQAVQQAPQNLGFLNKLGEAQLQHRETAKAMATFTRVLQLQPRYLAAINNLGFAWLSLGNAEKAGSYYSEALQLDPDYEPALLNKAGLYNFTGEKQKARAIVQRLLKRKPGDARLMQILEQLN